MVANHALISTGRSKSTQVHYKSNPFRNLTAFTAYPPPSSLNFATAITRKTATTSITAAPLVLSRPFFGLRLEGIRNNLIFIHCNGSAGSRTATATHIYDSPSVHTLKKVNHRIYQGDKDVQEHENRRSAGVGIRHPVGSVNRHRFIGHQPPGHAEREPERAGSGSLSQNRLGQQCHRRPQHQRTVAA